jgi:hypothetical protein
MAAWNSCATSHLKSKKESTSENIEATPKIIFLNYNIKSDKPNGTIEIRLIDKTIVNGKLKSNFTNTEISKPGDLKCMSLDNHLDSIDSILIPDPLNITLESVAENNQMFKKEITRDSAQFSIRLQLTERIYAIGIKKNTDTGNKNSFLLITKIK